MKPTVRIYSSNWCPFCVQAKRLLDRKGVSYQELIVDGDPSLRTKMMQESGRTSVPQIWINEDHIGGCDELYNLDRSAQLDSLLGLDR